jgi:2'-5' RNA ligase
MRLFFAVMPPPEAVERVLEVQRELRERVTAKGITWTKPEQFHYTLRFLGELPAAQALTAAQAAETVREAHAPFDLVIGGVGAFPRSDRPSTLWLGAREDAGAGALVRLAVDLEQRLVKQGFKKENRPPKAHLTLARVKSYEGESAAARLLRALPEDYAGHVATVRVDRFALMRSTLDPAGSIYDIVEEFRFAGPPAGRSSEETTSHG